jgi:hypothetical protein
MKKETLKTVIGKLGSSFTHMLLLILVYVISVFAQFAIKKYNDEFPVSPERYFDNNHVKVSGHGGQGSICVYRSIGQ